MTMMVFRSPGKHQIHGHAVDYKVVGDDEVDAHLAEGWHLSAIAAGASAQQPSESAEPADDAIRKPSREELEIKATELGIPFSARVSDRKLGEAIAAKLADPAGK